MKKPVRAMAETVTLVVPENYSEMRLDVFVSVMLENVTRSAVQKLIDNSLLTVNGSGVRKNYTVHENDTVVIDFPDPVDLNVKPQNIPLDIVYEDSDLLVVNKPKGMVVHPAAGNYEGTLVNALLYHCGSSLSGINGVIRPGIVHRIDKDTSGLLVVAKNDISHVGLAQQIKEHSFTREYQAVSYGKFKESEGTIDLPVGRDPKDRKKMTVTAKNSKNAVTHYFVIKEYSGFTYLRLRLETGRTHQIRVHLSHINHPIAGDKVYGPKKCITELNGQCLNAGLIGFIHPVTGKYMEFETPLPEYFSSFLSRLKEV